MGNVKIANRRGHSLWVSEDDGPLLRALAVAEDRPLNNILSRALRAYAAASPDYQARVAAGVPPPPAPIKDEVEHRARSAAISKGRKAAAAPEPEPKAKKPRTKVAA